ncbi:MAG: hypothetical protein ACOX1T_03380 [Saccharofermentanales bacterium]|jgi:hypothetical protein
MTNKIDTWIDRLFGIDQQIQTHEESLRYIYASLLSFAASRPGTCNNSEMVRTTAAAESNNGRTQAENILCLSFFSEEEMNHTVARLNELIKKDGNQASLELLAGGNLLTSADAMKKLSTCSAVVIFETKNAARISTVRKGLEVLYRMKKPVLGMVLME